jgi:hypothetical protein
MVNRLPRDYGREPTLLDPHTVHAFVLELLAYANANRTWGVEVAEALVDLIATRLSDSHASLDPMLAREVLSSIEANWRSEPLAYVDALCTVLANLGDTRPFLHDKIATSHNPEVRALLTETLMELTRHLANEARPGSVE